MTRLWLVRLGKKGEYEAATLQDNMLGNGFGIAELPLRRTWTPVLDDDGEVGA